MTPVEVIRGEGPVVLGQPHGGTLVPQDIAARLNATGRALADTDWYIGRLYEGLLPGATVVRATFHRYVIDANRDPSGASLYPGQNTTGLCPVTDFDGRGIYRMGEAPEADEVADRLARFHAPYHAALAGEVARVRARHGHVVLWDCHSIRSVIPFLFPGALPDLNIGTNGGATCDPAVERIVAERCGVLGITEVRARPEGGRVSHPPFTAVLNGRFKGGWTTRHYGRPAEGLHAIQMETAQSAYLEAEAPPWSFSEAKAARLRPLLARILSDLAAWRPA